MLALMLEMEVPMLHIPMLDTELEDIPGKQAFSPLRCAMKFSSDPSVADATTPTASPPLEANGVLVPKPAFSWPAYTDIVFPPGINEAMLNLQRPLIRIIIKDAFENVQANLLSVDAFPEPALSQLFIRDALLAAAESRRPVATVIYRRLLRDMDYLTKIAPLVCFFFFFEDDFGDAFHSYRLRYASFEGKSKRSAVRSSRPPSWN
jgi:hypothetical protein